MEKVVTTESGVVLEITTENVEKIKLEQLKSEEQKLVEVVDNAQNRLVEYQSRLALVRGRIALIEPAVLAFKEAHKVVEELTA